MNPGEKQSLKQVMQTQQVIVNGDLIEEVVEIGAVMRARPGPRIPGDEYIALVTAEGEFRWSAPLGDYDPDVVDDDPANEPRWQEV